MKEPAILRLYDLAWRLSLGMIRTVVRADGWMRRNSTKGRLPGLLPGRWQARNRMDFEYPEAGADQGPTVWLHAASLGEAKGLWALAESLLEGINPPGEPGWRILLSANTAEGFDYLESGIGEWKTRKTKGESEGRFPRLAACIAPLDHPDLVSRFLVVHRVAYVGLYEVELWPNFIRASVLHGIPVALISGRMTSRALNRYRFLRDAWSSLLDRLDWIQAQGESDAARFQCLTRTPVQAGFDFKAAHYFKDWDRAAPGRRADAASADTVSASGSRIAFISLHLQELKWLLPELPGLMKRFPLTIFPRRAGEMELFRKILLPMGFQSHSRSPRARHVLVDSFGKVGGILPECESAFVGGSLVPLGCHNLWEPLLAGLRIYFGPSIHNQESLARLLLDAGIAEVITVPSQIREWRKPDPALSGKCVDLAEAQLRFLEGSRLEFRARLETAMSRFYLFLDK